MDIGPDDAIRRLQHERNVWRGIAIGLAAVLVLLLALGAVGGVFLAERNEAVRAEGELREALQQAEGQVAEAEEALKKVRPITRLQAIKIAEDHLGMKGEHKSDVDPQEDGGWRVTIWRLPAVPGGFTDVLIDKQGKVVRVEPGK